MSIARHHHYLSQCYLNGFIDLTEQKKKQITSFDLTNKKIFRTSTRNVGGERDFNRVEINDIDPNYIEKKLADFESHVAEKIKQLMAGADFINEIKEVLLAYISLLAIRTPGMRNYIESKLIKPLNKLMVNAMVATPEQYSDILFRMQVEEGVHFENAESVYEQVKSNIENDVGVPSVQREFMISMEMECAKEIEKTLHARNWWLVEADEGDYFVTSDRPVNLIWKDGRPVPPGFGVLGTTVAFPVSQKLLLVGEFGGKKGRTIAPSEFVAMFNGVVISHAFERIFAANTHFKFRTAEGSLYMGEKIFSY
ncbi:DUF4238 domain-containing protein [Citrobacter amalonaticus]|nr:DUF4238 domain-containing protein [Citrobacter amalonaticus]